MVTFGTLLLALCLLLVASGAAPVRAERFDGYQVLRAFPRTLGDLASLSNMQKTFIPGLMDVWKEARDVNQTTDMMVSPKFVSKLIFELCRLKIKYQVAVPDVQKLVDSEISPSPSHKLAVAADVLTKYSSFTDISLWLDGIVKTCGIRCTLLTIGTSALGLPLSVVKVTGESRAANRKSIFIDGTIHAREWISTVMALNVINKLVVDYNVDTVTRGILDTFDWYVLPVANPDGYEYSRSANRMWRKNRRSTSVASCPGSDLNRNFNFHWMESGSSRYPCDDTYGGPVAFSEPESRAIRDFLLSIGNRTVMYLSLHSYGQYWLYSWGYSTVKAPDYLELKALSAVGANAIRRSSPGATPTSYTVGSAAGALYPSSGCSDDWAKGVAKIKYSFTVELPPADGASTNGFILAESKIPQVVRETWSGLKAVAEELKRNATVAG